MKMKRRDFMKKGVGAVLLTAGAVIKPSISE
jgi:hypothetical protein